MEGEWRTDYGKMTLSQCGGAVEGNYEHDQGQLTGADSALKVMVRPRKRSAHLRDVVGRRLRLGVGRPQAGPGR